jgi:hypothetical protein
MSVGNLTDQGNKGNNFPFQLSVLQLLEQLTLLPVAPGGGCCASDATEVTLLKVYQNSKSKINRIKGSGNYNRAFTYHSIGTNNVISIVHTGTTELGTEVITELFSYANASINGSNVTNIQYT